MALWYDSKKNEYASDGKKGWIKSYCDKALSEFNNIILAHFEGKSNRHRACDLDFDSDMTVEDKLKKIEVESNEADSRLKTELENEIIKKADSITNGGFVAGGGKISEGEGAVVIGNEAISSNGISIGAGAFCKSGVAVGKDAKVSADNGIQLGTGENTNEKTLKVYDYQITDVDSKTGQLFIKDIGKLSNIKLNIADVTDAINTLIDTDEDTINLIGDTQKLNTSTKENIVEVINEVDSKITDINKTLFKKTTASPDEILTPGFYYGGGVIEGTLGGSGTYWFVIEVYQVFQNLLQILHQNINGEWTTYYRNVSGIESSAPQFTEWKRLAKNSDVTALKTELLSQINLKAGKSEVGSLSDIHLNVTSIADAINTLSDTDEDTINLIGNTKNLATATKDNVVEAVNEVNQKIANEVNARMKADENVRKEIPTKTTENITSGTTDDSSYVTPIIVKNTIANLVESSEEIKNIADSLDKKADRVTNGGFIAGGAEAGAIGNISIGEGIGSTGQYGVVIGSGAEGAAESVAVGRGATAGADNAVAIGHGSESVAGNAVQICDGSNSDEETMKFRDYKIVEYDNSSHSHYLKDVGRIINLETKDKSSIIGAVNEIYRNLELSLVIPNSTSNSVIMTKDSNGQYKFSFTFHNAYIDSNGLFDNSFESQINKTFEINMFDAVEFNKIYNLYLEWDLVRDEFAMFSTAESFGTNLDTECLQFYIAAFTIVDEKTVDYYNEQDKSSVNLVPMIGNYMSRLDYKCYELQRDAAKKNRAVFLQHLNKSEDFNIWGNGNWIVGYSIPAIEITDDTYGSFRLPAQVLEVSGVKDEIGEEKKYCYVSYKFNVNNLSGEIDGSDVTVSCSLKEAKGKPNSYIEIEDETVLTSINIYLGTILLNAENDLTPDGIPGVIYSGSENTNEETDMELLKIFIKSGTVSGEIVEITADEVNALF